MLFFLLHPNHLETVIAMFVIEFLGALFDVMFVELWNFNILIAIVASSNKSALFGKMQIVEVLIFKFLIMNTTVFTIQSILIKLCVVPLIFHFSKFAIDIFLHRHQDHRVEFLKIFHNCIFSIFGGKICGYIVSPVLFREVELIGQEDISQKIYYLCPFVDYYSSESYLLEDL
jgi:hypothetical protein